MKTVDSVTLKSWLDKGEAVLVDVREPAEHAEKSIAGAHSLPLGKIGHVAVPDPRGRKLVMHCGGGGRSAKACETLMAQMAGVDIYNLEGGLRGWIAAGLPLKAKGEGVYRLPPVIGQVQVVAGSVIALSIMLGFFVGQGFYLLALLASMGLIFSGLAGQCYLATLLNKMPWNNQPPATDGAACMLKKAA